MACGKKAGIKVLTKKKIKFSTKGLPKTKKVF